MAFASHNISQTILLMLLLLLPSATSTVQSSRTDRAKNQTFHPEEELIKLKMIRAHLEKVNKPAVHTIQSPDGDLIDCVISHQQPAFDHPNLKGQKPLDPPERAEGHKLPRTETNSFQLWSMNGETCPEGAVPIRRTREDKTC